MNNVLEVKDVVKDYSNHRALDHVSMTVEAGKIHGLLGPNGAGKTTLIRILNRITAPDSGEILFEGRPFIAEDLNFIGYLPEERGLYRKMKVGEQAIYLAQLKGVSHKEAKKTLQEWFEKFDILNWWNKKVEELSKGMAQKVQFISTVMHKPSLLIFDEPFSGFDPVNAELLKREILLLKEQGSTIIFSTHNMQSVEEVCDNITLINKSKVVLEGEVRDVKEGYRGDKYKVVFKGGITAVDTLCRQVEISHQEQDHYGDTTLQLTNYNKLSSSALIQLCCSLGEVIHFDEVVPSMHDIFLDVVGMKPIDYQTSK